MLVIKQKQKRIFSIFTLLFVLMGIVFPSVRVYAAENYIITTVAGTGGSGYSGDGGAATSAKFRVPIGVAVDSVGNIYIADCVDHRIRKVNASDGKISTIAGNGTAGYSGDGGLATSAKLNGPQGVAVDSAGNIYIADTNNHRIRKVNAGNGKISTIAGNGTAGYSGDGGLATSTKLNMPFGVTADSAGNIYIGDTYNHRIRKVDVSNGKISTVAGNGTEDYSGDGSAATSAQLWCPLGVIVDNAGNIYIADSANRRIRKVDVSGTISTVAGNGTWEYSGDGGVATSEGLPGAGRIAVDSAGNIYITDANNNCIRKVDANDQTISTVAGNGTYGYSGDGSTATSASLECPTGVAVDSAGNIYIADSESRRIRKVATYTATLSQRETYIFTGQAAGYSSVAPQNATVTKTGSGDITNLAVTISGTNASCFTASTLSAVTLDNTTTTANFTVKPNDGLTAGTYTATVTVTADYGVSESFDVSFTVSTGAVPDQPTNTKVTLKKGQATIKFTKPSNTGGSPIIKYIVTATPTTSGAKVVTAKGTKSPMKVTGLKKGVNYTFTIKAVNAAGESVEVNIASKRK